MLKLLPALAIVVLFQAGAAVAEDASDFRVITHPGVKGGKVPRETLAGIFLKRVVRWSDGTPIEPVERSLTSPLRASFSRKILERTPAEVQAFWGRAMRDGVRPPVVKSSDEDVIAFVSSTSGAIGYVAAGQALPATVKPLDLQ